MRPRRRLWIGLALAGVGLVGVAAILDGLGLLAWGPSARDLVRRMLREWGKVRTYQADVSVGDWDGTSGQPRSCRQWWRPQELVLGTKDGIGFIHTERWVGSRWSYFQPGGAFTAHVEVQGTRADPMVRWRVAGFPSLEELTRVIDDSRGHRVVGSEDIGSGRAWIIECTPEGLAPSADTGNQAWNDKWFGRPWRIWLSEESGLPVHIRVSAPGSNDSSRIGIENIQINGSFPPNFRSVMGTSAVERRQLSLACNAASWESIQGVQKRIQAEVDAWRRTLLPGAKRGAGARTGPMPGRGAGPMPGGP